MKPKDAHYPNGVLIANHNYFHQIGTNYGRVVIEFPEKLNVCTNGLYVFHSAIVARLFSKLSE